LVGLCRIDVRLKGRLLDPIQQIALLYLGSFGEEPLFKEASDARHEIHAIHRLDASDKLVGLGDLLPLGTHDAHRRRRTGRGLRRCVSRQ
jgi:hypothetical protein